MELVEVPDPEPGDGEVVVEVARAGINFADTHATRNDYLAEQTLPLTPGGEISGRTADGRRVAALLANGGYAQKVVVPEDWLVPLPDEVSDDQAAALLLQGLTAHALVNRCARLAGGRDDRRPGRRRGHRDARGPARQARRRPGDRARLERREARARGAPRRGRDRRLARRGPEGGDPRGERGRAGRRRARDERRCHLRGLPADAGPVRPPGRVRNRLPRAERGQQRASAATLSRRDRLLAHAPDPTPRRGRDDDRRPVRRRCLGRARGRRRRRLSAFRGPTGPRGPGRAAHPGKLLLDPAA